MCISTVCHSSLFCGTVSPVFFSGSRCIKTTYTVRVNSHTVFIGQQRHGRRVVSRTVTLRYALAIYNIRKPICTRYVVHTHAYTHTAAARTYHRDLLHYIYVYISG